MKNPILTIITINYNNRVGLIKTIKSVVDQTVRDQFEYVIIDGGSTDGSREIIEEYSDRIDYWVSEPDKGIYNAMNKGVRVANGEYCLFLNSGDRLSNSTVLERVLKKKLLSYDHDIITGYTNIVKNGQKIGVWKPPIKVYTHFFLVDTISHQSSFIKKRLLLDSPYDESLKIVSDWKFWLFELGINRHSFYCSKIVISDFDKNGISNIELNTRQEERNRVLNEIPKNELLKILTSAETNLLTLALNSGFRSNFGLIIGPRLIKILDFFRYFRSIWK